MTRLATSAEPEHADLLATEHQLSWHQPAAQEAPWLRELFPSDRRHWKPDAHAWAFTTDAGGLVVREFRCSQRSLDAYAALVQQSDGSCPREAVLPCSITVGQPAIAAHQTVQAIAAWLALAQPHRFGPKL